MKIMLCCIDTSMNTSFYAYLMRTLPIASLMEVSELFPAERIDDLFRKEIDDLLGTHPSAEDREDLQRLRAMSIVTYVDASLRRAGFRDDERDQMVSDIITKMLLGSLFSGYRGGSLVARFKASVSNAIATLISRRSRHRKRNQELPPDAVGRTYSTHDLIHEFRLWLRARRGPLAVMVFDHRLNGGNSKELIGHPGIETSYQLKNIVKQIKESLRDYGSRDPEFLAMVEKAFATEAETMKKRFVASSPHP